MWQKLWLGSRRSDWCPQHARPGSRGQRERASTTSAQAANYSISRPKRRRAKDGTPLEHA
jgi:hypothetical protein